MRERERIEWGEGQRENLHADSREPDAGLDRMTPEITARAETKSPMPPRLSHPGALRAPSDSRKESRISITWGMSSPVPREQYLQAEPLVGNPHY